MNDELHPEASAPEHEPGQEPEAAPSVQPEEPIAESLNEPEQEATESAPRPAAKLERLQKILAQAGIASRRHAEKLITEGRVQVNGQTVTELGTKADPNRDHIRVDGKLLHGAERLRYFVLNKPKGYVTTVKDPEGRATVMQFFEKMNERLYPVGRLDYMSEGLLLVTNDGELANRLTKASSGIEKTYLVKVSGQPSEADLDILRGGVAIERGGPSEKKGKVRTAPARIRQVRQGDNPWFEVVLIEGRNRELRKMFEEIGHFVEKIRRVGYGPLVLDLEPGNLRELEPEELAQLRLAAEGKLRTPKAKDVRRRNRFDAQLPTLQPKPSRPRPPRPAETGFSAGRSGASRPKRSFGPPMSGAKPFRPVPPSGEEARPATGRSQPDRGPARGPSRPYERPQRTGPAKFGPGRPLARPSDRPASRPAWKKDERPARPYADKPAGKTYGARPDFKKPASSRPAWNRPDAKESRPSRPAWSKPVGEGRPPFKRPGAPRREAPPSQSGFVAGRPPSLRIDAMESEGQQRNRPESGQPRFDRPATPRPHFDRPRSDRSSSGRSSSGRSSAGRPPRREGGLSRPFTTSSGKPRAGGARPSNKSGSSGHKGKPGSSGKGKPGGNRPRGNKRG
jgi:23S rRNA pseudouridine2605 synthase